MLFVHKVVYDVESLGIFVGFHIPDDILFESLLQHFSLQVLAQLFFFC